MPHPDIDVEACVGCGSCLDACPAGVLEIVDDVAAVTDGDSCLGCGICVDTCPAGAITGIVED